MPQSKLLEGFVLLLLGPSPFCPVELWRARSWVISSRVAISSSELSFCPRIGMEKIYRIINLTLLYTSLEMTSVLKLLDIYQDDEDKRCSNFHYYEISARLSSWDRNMRNSSRHRLLYRSGKGGEARSGEIFQNVIKTSQVNLLFVWFKKIFQHYYRFEQRSSGHSLEHHRPASPRWRRRLRDIHLGQYKC